METNKGIRPVKDKQSFRNYDEGETIAAVRENYRKMRARQTVDYVRRMRAKYLAFDRPMQVWDALQLLNDFVDLSDPDVNLPNVMHLVQTAEAIRADGKPDWMQLVGLIHDLGKIMYKWGDDEDGTTLTEQWGLVGDIFLVGCRLPDTVVYPEFNKYNPDMTNPAYNTPTGMYEAHCGLDNCLTAWGHDEYLYQVLKNHPENTIPDAGMVMIRYHSFYPWHTGGSYTELTNTQDEQYKKWVLEFNPYDLYTKSTQTFDLDEIRAYYEQVIKKYLGNGPVYF